MSSDAVNALWRAPEPLSRSIPPMPHEPGIYAWWAVNGVLPHVPAPPHPTEALGLLYVGISPERSTSSARLDSRLLRQHLNGNIGSSTFRFALAALLFESEGWLPEVTTSGKYRLTESHNAMLSAWQRQHRQLSWTVVEEPWLVESPVIDALRPPLNRRGNEANSFHRQMGAARDRLRAAARGNPSKVPTRSSMSRR
jgi:hypothetical protein